MASNSNNNHPPRNRNKNRNYRGRRNSRPSYTGPAISCSICEKNIRDLSSAITEKESGKPAHFDCIISKIAENEPVQEQEKIVYLGSGRFAVIQSENNQNKNFKIIREIEYEEQVEDGHEWRNPLKKEIL